MTRVLIAGRSGSQRDVERLIATVLAAELVAPSSSCWLVSPRLGDVGILDNRAGAFRGLDPNWPPRALRLSELLAALLQRQARLRVVTEENTGNVPLLTALQRSARDTGVAERLVIRTVERLEAVQGLLTDDCVIHASLEFAATGIRVLSDELQYDIAPDSVAEAHVQFQAAYGPLSS